MCRVVKNRTKRKVNILWRSYISQEKVAHRLERAHGSYGRRIFEECNRGEGKGRKKSGLVTFKKKQKLRRGSEMDTQVMGPVGLRGVLLWKKPGGNEVKRLP